MRIQFTILIFITNFAFGQEKVTIDKNIPKYEIENEYNRFDDVTNEIKHIEGLKIIEKGENKIEIINSYSSGFTGNDIRFEINKNLQIENVTYDYWTDAIDLDNKISYKVKKATLKLNQNPFEKTKQLRGLYTLEIEYFWNDTLTENEIFKGKFKTFKGVDQTSKEYLLTKKYNKIKFGIIDENGVYQKTDRSPILKTDNKVLKEKIKELNINLPKRIKAWCVINKEGKIEPNSIKHIDFINNEVKNKIDSLLTKFTEWYPACVDEKEVKSRTPIIIGIE